MKISLSQIGNYQIIAVLGQGGMGKVYKAFDPKLKRTVALKTILPGKANAAAISRFHKEAFAISKLDHPSIVKIYTVGEEQGIHFFTMDYIDGMPLDKYVTKNNISMRKMAVLMRKIARGMHYAHEEGIVHRDLKPANIIVDKEGNPHIMDFGIAKIDSSEYQLTKTGDVLGTIFYMSPEQAKGFHHEVDSQSDVFSLGAIFYKLLTGKYAFQADTLMQLLHKIIYEEPILPTKIKKKIPKTLEKICLRALAKDKKQRYPSAQKYAEDLGKFISNRQVNVKSTINIRKYMYAFVSISLLVLVSFLLYNSNSSEQISLEKISDSISREKALYIKANDHIFEKDYDNALIMFEQLLTEPNDIAKEQIIARIIFILTEQQKNKEALLHYYMLDKPNSEVLLVVAKVYENMANIEKAIVLLDQVILLQENPSFVAKSLYDKGSIFYRTKDYKNSLVYFEQALGHLEKTSMLPYYHTDLLLSIGKSLFHLDNIDKAMTTFEKIASYAQKNNDFHEYLGKCYYVQKNYTLAANHFNEAIKLQPQYDNNYVWLAKIEEKQGNYTKAKTLISKALTLNVVNIEAVDTLLNIALKEPDIENSYFWTIAHYVGQLAREQRPETFIFEIEELYKKYHIYYAQWSAVKNPIERPDIFIDILSKSTNYNLYNNAIQGIISLRYHPETKVLLEQLLLSTEKNGQIYKNVEQTILILQKHIENEQRNVLCYFLIDFYLNKQFSSLTHLEMMKDKVVSVLQNKSNTTYIRYFAAHALANIGEFEILEEVSDNKEEIASLICKCVLREMGHFTNIADNLYLKNVTDEFLLTKIVRSMNFPLYFKVKEASDEQQQRIQYLLHWLNSDNDRARLHAAGILGRLRNLHSNKILLTKNRNILLGYMKDPNPYISNCAHYYFWHTLTRREFEQYRLLYIETLFANNNQITQTLLFFSFAFDMKSIENELAALIETTSDITVRILAIYALSVANTQHPCLEKILFDDNESFFMRAATGIFGNYQRVLDLFYAKNPLESFQKNLQQIRQQAQKIAQQKNEKLKIFMYVFNSFLFGETPIAFLEQEPSIDVKAHIIMSTCGGYKIPMLSLFSFGKAESKQREWTTKYQDSPHQKLQQMAIASNITSYPPSQRENAFQQYMKNNNTNEKIGAAKGFYCLVFLKIINQLSLDTVLDRELPNRKYDTYIHQLQQLPDDWKNIEQWLTYAIQLAPEAKYFYERAIINRQMQQNNQALTDLEQALKLDPENVCYQIEIADLLVIINKAEDANIHLETVTKQILDYTEWQKIGMIYWKLKDINNARKYFFKSIINNKEAYHIWASLHTLDANIWIARTYAYEGNNKKAIHYLRYYDSIEKRIYTTSRKNISPLKQSTIQNIPEFQNILSDPWIQALPK